MASGTNGTNGTNGWGAKPFDTAQGERGLEMARQPFVSSPDTPPTQDRPFDTAPLDQAPSAAGKQGERG
jgi:hypothetical protein